MKKVYNVRHSIPHYAVEDFVIPILEAVHMLALPPAGKWKRQSRAVTSNARQRNQKFSDIITFIRVIIKRSQDFPGKLSIQVLRFFKISSRLKLLKFPIVKWIFRFL